MEVVMGSWKKAMGAVVASVALALGAGFVAAAAGDDAGAGVVQAAQGTVKWFNAEKGFG